MIKVLKTGFFTSVQDLGRMGARALGVPGSGVMDNHSARLANALLGNDENDAVLEVTLTGPRLQFNCQTVICISGANMSPCLDERPIRLNRKIRVSKGSILSFGKLETGYRTYIAVAGGFQTEMVMNSRSMYANITLKNKIARDDILQIKDNIVALSKGYSSLKPNTDLLDEILLNAFKGPEFDLLPKRLQDQLQSRAFTISKNNDRMGYQLEEALENNLESILTAPVLPGTVQLTPSGNLIVLMRDGQTTGGYPRVLQLKEEAINVLAQKRVGDPIRFRF